MRVQGKAAGPVKIELNGLFGSFHVGQSRLKIQYVSTFANPANGDGHAALVKELMPMRERLEASKITDLRSLLQRDLNDTRVAQELIPYLRGIGTSGIGFFPAILAVLVPHGYLSGEDVPYPRGVSDADDPDRIHYDSCWSVQRFQGDNNVRLPLGLLEIGRDSTDIIVLDGQHRANAFRYLSGVEWRNEIYQAFYDGVERTVTNAEGQNQVFDADLPVTLIWFEAPEEILIRPDLISRRLFIDVNNNAKRVSASRTILLDDRAATCIATTQFYNYAAQRGFEPTRFSLLHSAFDMDSDLAQSQIHRFVLTTPEIINYALYWAFFSGSGNNLLSCDRVKREIANNRDRFGDIFPGYVDYLSDTNGDDTLDRYRRLFFPLPEYSEDFRVAFDKLYLPVLVTLFEQLSLLQPHYAACNEVSLWVRGSNSSHREVWDKVFCGGEGLYWSLQKASSVAAQDYRTAMREIEQDFATRRATSFGAPRADVDQVYEAFMSKAFQTGYIGAIEYLVSYITHDEYSNVADDLINNLNKYDKKQWMYIFRNLRPLIMSAGVDPKSWPMYRNLLVRMYDGKNGHCYNVSNWEYAPDVEAYKSRLRQKAVAYSNTLDIVPDISELQRTASAILTEIEVLLDQCGLSSPNWYDHDKILQWGVEHLLSETSKLIAP